MKDVEALSPRTPRRVKRVLLLSILSLLLFFLVAQNRQAIVSGSRTAAQRFSGVTALAKAKAEAIAEGNAPIYEGTSALSQLAASQAKMAAAGGKGVKAIAGAAPTGIAGLSPVMLEKQRSADHLRLLLLALKDTSFRVPGDKAERQSRLLPRKVARGSDEEQAYRSALESIEGKGEDWQLYRTRPGQWRAKHTTPIVLFTKTYCPYSRKAKELLTSLGAQIRPIEVDLRQDADELKALLGEGWSHNTFPTVFISNDLVGGFDDLEALNSAGVLHGMLEGSGAMRKLK